ncbi:hypothetical protein BpHYR1_009857 [Brachionus plicatilis]|uniref:Uncharacterized protein n=1 Tax=Brachionus plicatilis TaxID=10195 RepID=A0A3M7SE57_BRAPC|nr:hypothetical protein BpHYR1_009857 [Brachionus plicatilis]
MASFPFIILILQTYAVGETKVFVSFGKQVFDIWNKTIRAYCAPAETGHLTGLSSRLKRLVIGLGKNTCCHYGHYNATQNDKTDGHYYKTKQASGAFFGVFYFAKKNSSKSYTIMHKIRPIPKSIGLKRNKFLQFLFEPFVIIEKKNNEKNAEETMIEENLVKKFYDPFLLNKPYPSKSGILKITTSQSPLNKNSLKDNLENNYFKINKKLSKSLVATESAQISLNICGKSLINIGKLLVVRNYEILNLLRKKVIIFLQGINGTCIFVQINLKKY